MIDKHRLQGWIHHNKVMFDKHGERVEGEMPPEDGPAVLVVGDVTDALKEVEAGHVVGSADRGQIWRVSAIVLDSDVVDRLPDSPMEVHELLDAVREQDLSWQVSLTSAP